MKTDVIRSVKPCAFLSEFDRFFAYLNRNNLFWRLRKGYGEIPRAGIEIEDGLGSFQSRPFDDSPDEGLVNGGIGLRENGGRDNKS